ncbi:MAG: hypothetical protein EXQ56_12025 [Acidobacteria bacterium]|nr:hypothetical protein [Acidobacteriota bacterium]
MSGHTRYQVASWGRAHLTSKFERHTIAVLLGEFDPEIRIKFIKGHDRQIDRFVGHIAEACRNWQRLDAQVKGSMERAHITALVYGTINNLVIAMKLMMIGLPIQSGHVHRQVLEGIAVSILASRRNTGVLKKYMDGKYSTQKAISHLVRLSKNLDLNKEGVETLERASKFRDQFSHPTQMTIAHAMFLNPPGPLIL